jgi:hypothetical protein
LNKLSLALTTSRDFRDARAYWQDGRGSLPISGRIPGRLTGVAVAWYFWANPDELKKVVQEIRDAFNGGPPQASA